MFRKSREHMRMQPIATKTFASRIWIGRLGIAGLLLALGSLTSCYTHVATDDDYYAYHRPRHRAVVQQDVYDTVYAEQPQQVVDSTHGDTTFVTERPRDDQGYGSAGAVNNYYDDPYWNAYWGSPYGNGWGLSFAFGAYDPFYVGYGFYDPFFTPPYYGGWYGPGPFWYPGFYHRWGWGYGGGGYYRGGYDRGFAYSGSGRFANSGFGRINGGESRIASYPLIPSGNGLRAMAPSSASSRAMSRSNGTMARSNAGSWPIGVVPNSVRSSNQAVSAGNNGVANANATGARVNSSGANSTVNAAQSGRVQNMQSNASPASTGRHIVVVRRANGGSYSGGARGYNGGGRASGSAPGRAYGGGNSSGRSYGGGRSNGGGGGGRSSGGGGGHSGGGGRGR